MELMIVACLLSDPKTCQSFAMGVDLESGMMACVMQGQTMAIQWSEEHPKCKVNGWRCLPPGKDL